MGRFPGVSVSIVPSLRYRSAPQCPNCQEAVPLCPSCGADPCGTEEQGVDIRIATDMIMLAWIDNYDTAVLLSSDKDFIPLVEVLETRGIKVLHAAFPPHGAHLSRACWDTIDLPRLHHQFER